MDQRNLHEVQKRNPEKQNFVIFACWRPCCTLDPEFLVMHVYAQCSGIDEASDILTSMLLGWGSVAFAPPGYYSCLLRLACSLVGRIMAGQAPQSCALEISGHNFYTLLIFDYKIDLWLCCLPPEKDRSKSKKDSSL